MNSSSGLIVEVEGPTDELRRFEETIEGERPKASAVTVHESLRNAAQGSTRFEIHSSDTDEGTSVIVLPDLTTL